MSDQAIQQKLKITRDQLAEAVGQDHNTIRQFERLFEVINGFISAEDSLIQDIAHPIGELYVQYPGKEDPNNLFPGQTWTNISSDFAGDFFRAEDDGSGPGKASTFESGRQDDAMQRITGTFGNRDGSTHPGGSYRDGDPQGLGVFSPVTLNSQGQSATNNTAYVTVRWDFDSADSVSPNTAKTDDDETRPVNQTIRIWERTA